MYRLKVKISSRRWKTGINTYETYLEAQIRQEELRLIGIKSIIVNGLGGQINETLA